MNIIESALEQYGLNFSVATEPVYTATGEPVSTGHKRVYRTDTGEDLGVVGKGYHPLQNREAMRPLEDLIETGYLKIIAGGTLQRGARVFLQTELIGARADVLPGDTVKRMPIFYNAHNGSLQAAYQNTDVRVRCANRIDALIAAARKKGSEAGTGEARIMVRHTRNVSQRVDALAQEFNAAVRNYSGQVEKFQTLAGKDLRSESNLTTYFESVLRVDERKERTSTAEVLGLPGAQSDVGCVEPGKRQIEALRECFVTQPGVEFGTGSYWQAYNAVTYWLDHSRGRSEESRLNASWFGDGQAIRTRAMTIALQA